MKIIKLFLLCALIISCSSENNEVTNIEESDKNTSIKTTKAVQTASSQTSNVTFQYIDESAFINSLSDYPLLSPNQITLNRTATTSGYNEVYGFNIPTENQVTGFKWNKGDQDTEDWRPQGITGFNWNGKRYLLATWYGIGPSNIQGVYNQHKGCRVSLVDITDMNNIKYRHVLLVQNKDNINNPDLFRHTNSYEQLDLFAPIPIHAGGVAHYNGKLFVASTNLGIRVFDLDNFIHVTSDPTYNKIGRDNTGVLKAFNYVYVLPQSGYYKMNGSKPHSNIALGEDSSQMLRLFTGQYKSSNTNAIPKIFGFPINSNGDLTSPPLPDEISPKDNATGNNGPVYNIQGVYRYNTTTVMAVTGKSIYQGSSARLIRYRDGDMSGTRYRWPHGAEDLFYDQNTGYLWNLTEFETSLYGEENRCVFAVRYSDYN